MHVYQIGRKATLLGILAFVFVFSQKQALAASELETWCLSVGEIWDSTYSRCSVYGSASITETLNILPGEGLVIYGSLINEGYMYNNGHIWTYNGDLYNYSVIKNNNTLDNSYTSDFINYGLVINTRYFNTFDFSLTTNNGIITNLGRIAVGNAFITNNVLINNYCSGTISTYNGSILGNPVVYFENCFYFPVTLR